MPSTGDSAALLRIVDANANRAREALRVVEEYARFVLDDAHLTERCKTQRHRLRQALDGLAEQTAGLPLALFRDTPGDVGTELSTPEEARRDDALDVLNAAAARLTEALRSLEEYGKQIAPSFSKQIEQLRYDTYTTASHIIRRASPVPTLKGARLYVLLTESLCRMGWFETAEAALHAGAKVLQLREKDLPDGELFDRARRLRGLCERHDALLIINDRADIAAATQAHGVHVGQKDLAVRALRRLLGPRQLVGVSTNTPQQAELALEQAPDYLAVGPMFASTTKAKKHIAGPQTLETIRKLTALPLVAIGGITPGNADQLQAADTLAVCAAIISSTNVADAVKAFVAQKRTAM